MFQVAIHSQFSMSEQQEEFPRCPGCGGSNQSDSQYCSRKCMIIDLYERHSPSIPWDSRIGGAPERSSAPLELTETNE